MKSNSSLFTMNSLQRSLLQLGRALVTNMKRPAQLRARLAVTGYLLLLGMNSTLFAQATPDRDKLHFRTLGWEVAPDDLFYSMGGKDVNVKIFEGGRSGFQEYPKREEISFYRIVKKEDDTEEHVIVAKGNLTGRGPTPLLIMTKSKEDPDKFDMTVIADDLTAFPERTCRFVNFTPIDVGITLGKEAATIPAGDSRLVDTKMEEGDSTRYVTVYVKINYEKLMLSYNNWVFRPGQRVMVFISVDEEGQPRVIRLVDAVGPLKPFQAPTSPP